MKNILISGGSGFIGSHVVEKLINKNHKITVVDLWESEEIRNLKQQKKIEFFILDIHNNKQLEELVEKNNYFIHLAAILGTSETITTYDIEDVVRTNILGTTKILKLRMFALS